MKHLVPAALAAALLAVPVATPAVAMPSGHSNLELSVQNHLARSGIAPIDTSRLTLNQLVRIKSVLTAGDYSQSERRQQIELIRSRL